MTPNAYATLAIYSKHFKSDEVTALLEISPTRVGEKGRVFSWLLSTIEVLQSNRIEDHASEILKIFDPRRESLRKLALEGCEIRLWLYFGLDQPNRAFVVSPELIEFLGSLQADICIDVWSRGEENKGDGGN
ncbi:DUF4279 domain-containing protein [Lysobacter sp. CFH 32150]|uniref:DUF4279 domain-containing protein n=1 Tax=Lysobacter sp. CFH 32150 TaxID=2927128 RepID=UPI001FA80ECD|nr:DUF4279 domain-containing protein [Lysobacter sp. CFH 32150]MCI4569371.1 DUF4279 domain-containing protein [Lysobacter sp. CFH 32150]